MTKTECKLFTAAGRNGYFISIPLKMHSVATIVGDKVQAKEINQHSELLHFNSLTAFGYYQIPVFFDGSSIPENVPHVQENAHRDLAFWHS